MKENLCLLPLSLVLWGSPPHALCYPLDGDSPAGKIPLWVAPLRSLYHTQPLLPHMLSLGQAASGRRYKLNLWDLTAGIESRSLVEMVLSQGNVVQRPNRWPSFHISGSRCSSPSPQSLGLCANYPSPACKTEVPKGPQNVSYASMSCCSALKKKWCYFEGQKN